MNSNTESDFSGDEDQQEIQLLNGASMYPTRRLSEHSNVFKGKFMDENNTVQECAIKFPRDESQYDSEKYALEKLRERCASEGLGSNSHVVSLLQTGHFREQLLDHRYIVLERCHCLNLRQFMEHQRQSIPVYDVSWGLRICKHIIKGVIFIQEPLLIVHRDLKPSNILLTGDLQTAKIADLGSSLRLQAFTSAVYRQEMFGTIGFRPPEGYGNSYVSLRTDTFSLGALIYFILSDGKSSFGDQDDLWDHNAMTGVVDLTGLKVSNKETTRHLLKSMLHLDRRRRPAMFDVDAHPCWSKSEIRFEHEYWIDEVLEDPEPRTSPTSESDHDNTNRDFFRRLSQQLGIQPASPEEATETFIVICNKENHSMQRLSLVDNRFSHFHDYNDKMKTNFFSTVYLNNYLYVLTYDKPVYRLKCTHPKPTWERMADMIAYHGQHPPAVANQNSIYVVGKSGRRLSSTITKFETLSNEWTILEDKKISTSNSAVVSAGNFIYSIGGAIDQSQNVTNVVERIDLRSKRWQRVTPMPTARFYVTASHHKGNIIVVGGKGNNLQKINIAECYDTKWDQWTVMPPMTLPRWGPRYRCHEIGDILYVVGGDGPQFAGETIEKYDATRKEWRIVGHAEPNLEIWMSAIITIGCNNKGGKYFT